KRFIIFGILIFQYFNTLFILQRLYGIRPCSLRRLKGYGNEGEQECEYGDENEDTVIQRHLGGEVTHPVADNIRGEGNDQDCRDDNEDHYFLRQQEDDMRNRGAVHFSDPDLLGSL